LIIDYDPHEQVDKGFMREIYPSFNVLRDVEESLAGDGKSRVKQKALSLGVHECEIEMIPRFWLFLLDGPEGVDDDNAQVVKSDQPQPILHYLPLDHLR